MEELVELLKQCSLSIASVESFTVGHFAHSIGKVPGASSVYRGTLVSYQTRIKRDVLGIDEKIIERYGVVSKEVVGLMAINGQKMFDSDLCVSFSGNAGPSAMEGKKVGLIYIGIAYFDNIYTFCYELDGSREDIIEQAVCLSIEKIVKLIKKNRLLK